MARSRVSKSRKGKSRSPKMSRTKTRTRTKSRTKTKTKSRTKSKRANTSKVRRRGSKRSKTRKQKRTKTKSQIKNLRGGGYKGIHKQSNIKFFKTLKSILTIQEIYDFYTTQDGNKGIELFKTDIYTNYEKYFDEDPNFKHFTQLDQANFAIYVTLCQYKYADGTSYMAIIHEQGKTQKLPRAGILTDIFKENTTIPKELPLEALKSRRIRASIMVFIKKRLSWLRKGGGRVAQLRVKGKTFADVGRGIAKKVVGYTGRSQSYGKMDRAEFESLYPKYMTTILDITNRNTPPNYFEGLIYDTYTRYYEKYSDYPLFRLKNDGAIVIFMSYLILCEKKIIQYTDSSETKLFVINDNNAEINDSLIRLLDQEQLMTYINNMNSELEAFSEMANMPTPPE